MVSLCAADGTVGMDVLVVSALVALLLEGTVGLDVVVFPAVLAGTFKFL